MFGIIFALLAASPQLPESPPETTTITMVGDIMMGTSHPSKTWLDPRLHGGKPAGEMLDPELVEAIASSDISIGNLEGALFDGHGPHKACSGNCYVFKSPEDYALHLRSLGFDAMSLANNHSGDWGDSGRTATVSALRSAGIAYAGLDEACCRTATLALDGGSKVGFVAYAPNHGTLPLNDIAGMSRVVRGLSESHDIVVVSFHGGAEGRSHMRVPHGTETFYGENRGDLRRFSKAAIDAGADVVFGHGPHVPRGIEIYKERLVAYSLGNFWTYRGISVSAESGVAPLLQVEVGKEGELICGRIVSVTQHGDRLPKVDPEKKALSLVAALSKADFPETAPRVFGDGSFGRCAEGR